MKALSRLLVALGLIITLSLSRATASKGGGSVGKCGPHATIGANNLCRCVHGFHSKNGTTDFTNATEIDCKDIDECKANASLCKPGGECQNTPGTYVCNCNEGFAQSSRNDRKICTDIDECKANASLCKPGGECKNMQGDYYCKCNKGFAKSGRDDRKICTALPCPKLSSINCSDAQDRFCKLATELRGLCTAVARKQSSDSLDKLMQTLMVQLAEIVDYLTNMDKTQRHRRATQLMQMAESLLRFLVVHLPEGSTNFGSSRDIDLSIEIRTNRSESLARLSQDKTRVEVDWSAVNKMGKAFNMVGLLTYENLKSVLTEAEVKGKQWEEFAKFQRAVKPSYKVLSRVASAFVNHDETMSLSTPVTFSFTHPEPNSEPDVKVICAFWEPHDGTGRWSEEGCRRLNSSTSTTFCQCDHMTSFAVLMAFYDVQDRGLDIITKIGLVVSLVCLFLAILTFLFCRVIRGIRTSIHLHLCLALFAGYVTFLMGAGNPSNMTACAVVAGLLHYFFLSVFCWMLLEGVELYLMVVQVFKTHSLKHWHIFLVGYGLPAVVVGISAAVNSEGYGGKNCWLARERGFLWSFLAPVAVIIVINAIVFVITIWKLSEKFADINPDMNRLKRQRVLTITAIAQLCILGLTWVFGLFQFGDHTLAMSYIFAIFNSLQGLFIFILHCLLKQQVRDEYYRWFCKGGFGKVLGSDKYSDFSATTGSNTLRANKSSSESGV